MTENVMKMPDIRDWPGYVGAFTRDQAEGAIPNGATIRKAKLEKNDSTPLGTLGVVLGSFDGIKLGLSEAERNGSRFMYFIEWFNKPGCAVCVVDWKIEAAPH
jgi:hypothetical protein